MKLQKEAELKKISSAYWKIPHRLRESKSPGEAFLEVVKSYNELEKEYTEVKDQLKQARSNEIEKNRVDSLELAAKLDWKNLARALDSLDRAMGFTMEQDREKKLTDDLFVKTKRLLSWIRSNFCRECTERLARTISHQDLIQFFFARGYTDWS